MLVSITQQEPQTKPHVTRRNTQAIGRTFIHRYAQCWHDIQESVKSVRELQNIYLMEFTLIGFRGLIDC